MGGVRPLQGASRRPSPSEKKHSNRMYTFTNLRVLLARLCIASVLLSLLNACRSASAIPMDEETLTPATHSTLLPSPRVRTPTSTHRPMPIPSQIEAMHEPLLLLAGVYNGTYLIEDLHTGTVRAWRPEEFIQEVIQWEGDGCTLLVRLDNSLAEISLDGKVRETIFSFDKIPSSGGANSTPTLAPDKTWVSYLVGTGDYEVPPDPALGHYEMEELQTMP
jgi:hypothetical protein